MELDEDTETYSRIAENEYRPPMTASTEGCEILGIIGSLRVTFRRGSGRVSGSRNPTRPFRSAPVFWKVQLRKYTATGKMPAALGGGGWNAFR